MDAIRVLMDEHQEILQVLDALEGCAATLVAGGDVPRADVHGFVRFIREYADACHHGKEEDMLFQDMMRHGLSRDAGPLAVMYHEHDEGRGYVGQVAAAAAGDGALDDDARARIASGMRAYVALLRDHIAKEDEILYVMARQIIPPAELDDLGHRFEAFAASDARARPVPELLAMAADLSSRYAPSR